MDRTRLSLSARLVNVGEPDFQWRVVQPKQPLDLEEKIRLRYSGVHVPKYLKSGTNLFQYGSTKIKGGDPTPFDVHPKLSLDSPSKLLTDLTAEFYFPSFFLGYAGHWISLDVMWGMGANYEAFNEDDAWVLDVDLSPLLDLVEHRAVQYSPSPSLALFRTWAFGRLKTTLKLDKPVRLKLKTSFAVGSIAINDVISVFTDIATSLALPQVVLDLSPTWNDGPPDH